jgi:hypothetical protein
VSRILYVVGTGFTGSTLLAFLLDAHPRIATVGEATGPIADWGDQRAYECSCGAPVSECSFWKQVGEEMARRGQRFGPNAWDLRFELGGPPLARLLLTRSLRNNALDATRDALVLRVPGWGDALRERARRNQAFVESVLAVTGAEVFLDASKDPRRAVYLEHLTGLELRVVHLVRDPRGFVASHVKNRGASLESGVRAWKRMLGHARRLEARLGPGRFLRVRYEDLCTRVEDEVGRIQRFAGVEPLPGPIDFRAGAHHIIGNRMRLAGSRQVVLDEQWRERLSPDQRDAIDRRTARGRRLLGYA